MSGAQCLPGTEANIATSSGILFSLWGQLFFETRVKIAFKNFKCPNLLLPITKHFDLTGLLSFYLYLYDTNTRHSTGLKRNRKGSTRSRWQVRVGNYSWQWRLFLLYGCIEEFPWGLYGSHVCLCPSIQ